MITLIRYFDGRLQGGGLLSITDGHARLAVPGCDDTIVFKRQRNLWCSEAIEAAVLEFSVADTEAPYLPHSCGGDPIA